MNINIKTQFSVKESKDTCFICYQSCPDIVSIKDDDKTIDELIDTMMDEIDSRPHQNYIENINRFARQINVIFGSRGAICLTLGIDDYSKAIDLKHLRRNNFVGTFIRDGDTYIVIILKNILFQLCSFASQTFKHQIGELPKYIKLSVKSKETNSGSIIHNTIPSEQLESVFGHPDQYIDIPSDIVNSLDKLPIIKSVELQAPVQQSHDVTQQLHTIVEEVNEDDDSHFKIEIR